MAIIVVLLALLVAQGVGGLYFLREIVRHEQAETMRYQDFEREHAETVRLLQIICINTALSLEKAADCTGQPR
jgi:hypothetical protein